MRGVDWRRWNSLESCLIPLVSTSVRVAWLAPLIRLILNSPLVNPPSTRYPAWLVAGVLLVASVMAATLRHQKVGPWLGAAAGLAVALSIASYVFRGDRVLTPRWPREFALAFVDFHSGVPAPLLVTFITAALWRSGLRARWGDYHYLWHSFVAGVVVLGCMTLLADSLVPRAARPQLAVPLVAFVVSGLLGLALVAVSETLSVEQARGGVVPRLSRHWLTAVGTAVLVILVGAWALGQALSPNTVAEIAEAFRPAVRLVGHVLRMALIAISYVIVMLLMPLINALKRGDPAEVPPAMDLPTDLMETLAAEEAAPTGLPPALRIALIVLSVAGALSGIIAAFVWSWRRRGRRDRQAVRMVDQREYIWSLRLIRDQLRDLLQRQRRPEQAYPFLDLPQPSELRQAIRSLYQRLLARASALGYPRSPSCTPSVYQDILERAVPSGSAALGTLTSEYLLARYAPDSPNQTQLERARLAWAHLEAVFTQPSGRTSDTGRKATEGGGQHEESGEPGSVVA